MQLEGFDLQVVLPPLPEQHSRLEPQLPQVPPQPSEPHWRTPQLGTHLSGARGMVSATGVTPPSSFTSPLPEKGTQYFWPPARVRQVSPLGQAPAGQALEQSEKDPMFTQTPLWQSPPERHSWPYPKVGGSRSAHPARAARAQRVRRS